MKRCDCDVLPDAGRRQFFTQTAAAASVVAAAGLAAPPAKAAPEMDKRKFALLVKLQLHDYFDPQKSLTEVMDDLAKQAKERGLTPEILESILNEG